MFAGALYYQHFFCWFQFAEVIPCLGRRLRRERDTEAGGISLYMGFRRLNDPPLQPHSLGKHVVEVRAAT